MKSRHGFLALGAAVAAFSAVAAEKIGDAAAWSSAVSTTFENRWFEPKPIPAAPETEMTIDPSAFDQIMVGFGTALSELSWEALQILSPEDRAQLLDDMFAPEKGANFTVVRTPIGASDFAFDYYSYNDHPGDFDQKKFSLEIDERALLPLLREIKARVPADLFRLWASPWTPPRWMKSSGCYASRPSYGPSYPTNDCDWAHVVYNGEDGFACDAKHYASYARYFRKYVDAMKAKGFPVWMVMPQNEPGTCQPYPTCPWRGRTLADFTANYLGPALEGSGTELYMGTIEERSIEKVHDVMALPNGRKYIKGAGFQWEGRGSIGAARKRYPDLQLVMSEQECNDGRNDWKGALHSWGVMRTFIGQGAGVYNYWNLALTDLQKSSWGWSQNSLVTVDRKTRKAVLNVEYYILKQVSSKVRKGAKRLLTRGDLSELAFLNPDGSLVVSFANSTPEAKTIVVRHADKTYRASLPPNSISTFVASGK
jgi:glucosylceramidase